MQFPSSPTLNQTYTYSNKTWKWNGKGWQINAANSLSWSSITDKPTEFTPSTHSHTISNVSGLQSALDAKAPLTHVGSTGDAHGVATTSVNGFMSSTDKSKLDGIATGAEVNQNAFSTVAVSGQSNVVADAKSDTLTLVGGTGVTITTNASTDTITFTNSAPDQTVSLTGSGATTVTGTYPNFTISSTDTTYSAGNGLTLTGTSFAIGTPSTITGATTNSVTSTSHTHALTITKANVGLGNVDNTSDLNKPISTATQTALDGKVAATSGTASRLTLNDGYIEEVFAITDGSTVFLSPDNGSIQTWTLGANRTPLQTDWASGQSITLLINDGSARTINWGTVGVVWKTDGGSAPELNTSGYTVIALWKVGSTIYGARVGDA